MSQPMEKADNTLTFKVTFVYFDGKDLSVSVEPENLDKLFKELGQKGFYWNKNRTGAFYTDLSNVRFIQVLLQLPSQPKIEKVANANYTTDEVKDHQAAGALPAAAA